ncbi:hypothetical protein [Rhabdochromatium marinum]|uniref:hypothetical protein n=1 Tax=Rhabdochromatium marinum TaxID=48729 RepID=UPI001905B5B4|nr:hypothetical protein [Rhabdochromatium marinum]MBK1648343.1 hypothetical protein [Rhabdochromatium marinum]
MSAAVPSGATRLLAVLFVTLGWGLLAPRPGLTAGTDSTTASTGSTPAAAAPPLSSSDQVSSPDQAQLVSALHAAEALWQSLGEMRDRLLGNAERALDQADRATTLDERQRQEALYRQLSDRLVELDHTRTELKTQLERLRQQLNAVPRPE